VRIAPEPFAPPDALALRTELAADIAARFGGRDTEPGVKPTAADVLVFLVARDDAAAPLGCGALRRIDAKTVEIKRMYVRPAARRTGLGRALLDALEDEARAAGADRVVLETGTEQHEATALYEAAGYRPTPCFGAYAASPISRCYERDLPV